jgi:hypothetical protein
MTDIGLIQKDPFQEDLSRSLKHLDRFFPLDKKRLGPIINTVSGTGGSLILCDIAPMGIKVGGVLNIPSVLIENFTWDWIYAGYVQQDYRIQHHISYLEQLFGSADYHIQTEPVCNPNTADLTVGPVSRSPRTSRREIRSKLNIPETAPLVVITMGGIPRTFGHLETLAGKSDYYFVISGGGESFYRERRVTILPYHAEYYHPDLIHAADVVVGKCGYSTLAEVYYAGIPFVFIKRPAFRESNVLTPFIKREMNGVDLSEEAFEDNRWLALLPDLLHRRPIERGPKTGAEQAAEFIVGLLSNIS